VPSSRVELIASTSLGAPVENVVILVTFTVVGAVELVASTSLDAPVENVVILVTFMAVGVVITRLSRKHLAGQQALQSKM